MRFRFPGILLVRKSENVDNVILFSLIKLGIV